jgi:peptidoglycan/LPS O-acetylase OafA/YrhL
MVTGSSQRLAQMAAVAFWRRRTRSNWPVNFAVLLSRCCYRPRYLNIQRLNYLWTIRHSSARIAGNLIT